jgi:hypothetical protein
MGTISGFEAENDEAALAHFGKVGEDPEFAEFELHLYTAIPWNNREEGWPGNHLKSIRKQPPRPREPDPGW